MKNKSNTLYVEFVENRSGGEPEDPAERWTSYSDTYIDVKFVRFHRENKDNNWFDSVEVDDESLLRKDKLYLGVVRYSTGDTFSHTIGAWHLVGVKASYEEAGKMLKEALKGNGHKPWQGYFEDFSGTEIYTLEVV